MSTPRKKEARVVKKRRTRKKKQGLLSSQDMISLLAVELGILIVVFAIAYFSLLANFNSAVTHIQHAEFDRLRIEGITNTLLSIQDYLFLERELPASLQELVDKEYASLRDVIDPETKKTYLYYNEEGRSFVLCAHMYAGIKGVQPEKCMINQEGKLVLAPGVVIVKKKEEEKQEKTIFVRVVNGIPHANVRMEPTTQSEIIDKVYTGDKLIFEGETRQNWYHIRLDEETQGWLYGDYAQLEE